MSKTDIAIVGAGPAGLACAAFAARLGFRVRVLDRQPGECLAVPEDDGREIALTHKSVRLLQSLGAWQHLSTGEIGPLQSAHVTDGASPYCLKFSDDRGSADKPLGYIVANSAIRRALHQVVSEQQGIQICADSTVTHMELDGDCRHLSLQDEQTVSASLVVASDSRFSEVRRMAGIGAEMHDFGRSAIVGRIHTSLPHRGIAQECFGYGATLALLPLAQPQESSAVVTVASDSAQGVMALSDEEFANYVTRASSGILGSVTSASPRFCYPLVAVYARRFYAQRLALVGDAAVGMHPVTAHGFNLGIASANTLAAQLARLSGLVDGKPLNKALGLFQLQHRLESRPIYRGTNLIVNLFTNNRAPAKLLRKAVLRISNNFRPIRQAINYQLTR
ncbi:5-demethoxyubiquinol-8 5-hydroxylase UbiM [Microbulbifer discodermiae]|uniref:5-demethoxyubiquinol-8 5-hydroxylase UbiM n=1 Tax=Microbulbifer sp. 2201CG32-9 TaxID=3232309 RepID=UPI00345C3193